jgi:hypothetical protein
MGLFVCLWEAEVYSRLIYMDHTESLVELISVLHSWRRVSL